MNLVIMVNLIKLTIIKLKQPQHLNVLIPMKALRVGISSWLTQAHKEIG